MKKFKYFINFDKEEKWLEEMAKNGYQLESKGFKYNFIHTEPEETTIKTDYRKFKTNEDFMDYLTLFADSGWDHIAGTKSSGTQYFKKTNKANGEDIFSDKQSKAGKYNRLSQKFMELGICFMPIFAALLTTETIKPGAILDPRQLYLTENLWEMSGSDFWSAFAFETPFAMFRAIVWLYYPVTILLYFAFSWKAKNSIRIPNN